MEYACKRRCSTFVSPCQDRDEVFLMNTFTDAQLMVSRTWSTFSTERGAGPRRTRRSALERRGARHARSARRTWLSSSPIATASAAELRAVLPRRAREHRHAEASPCSPRCSATSPATTASRGTTATTTRTQRRCRWTRRRGWPRGSSAGIDAIAPEPAGADVLRGRAPVEPASPLLPGRAAARAPARRAASSMSINIITNGLLLSREMVERLNPLGLNGIKITLDGDRETHNRTRPLRGGQGTFDRIIPNTRDIARPHADCRLAATSTRTPPTAIRRSSISSRRRSSRRQAVAASPSSRSSARSRRRRPSGVIPLTVVGARGQAAQRRVHDLGRHRREPRLRHLQLRGREDGLPARGDEEARIRDRRRRAHGPVRDPQVARPHGRPRRVAVRLPGLCRRGAAVHRPHRRTAGGLSHQALRNFERLAAWEQCNDCAFIPVCAGGCTVAAHNELGDMHAPNCHKPSFEAGVVALAHDAVRALAHA